MKLEEFHREGSGWTETACTKEIWRVWFEVGVVRGVDDVSAWCLIGGSKPRVPDPQARCGKYRTDAIRQLIRHAQGCGR